MKRKMIAPSLKIGRKRIRSVDQSVPDIRAAEVRPPAQAVAVDRWSSPFVSGNVAFVHTEGARPNAADRAKSC